MIKTTTWSPDTCKCVLVYSWDTEAKEDNRVHTPVSGTPCDVHAAHADDVEMHHEVVLAENQGKNQAYEEACQAVPKLLPEDFTFSFDKNRTLTFEVKGITDVELTAINTRIAQNLPEVAIQVTKKIT